MDITSNKIERQLVNFEANTPKYFYVKGGFDYYDTIFYISYSSSAFGKKITAALKDADGRIASKIIKLDVASPFSFQFNPDIEDRNFGCMQLISEEDVSNIEIWSEIIEGGFF